jgi:RimJ/RimL family protein N-acetyltransferase
VSAARPPFALAPVVLDGEHVRLVPLAREHLDGLAEVTLGHGIFRYFPMDLDSRPALAAFIEHSLREQAAGAVVPFATTLRADGRVVGSTSFLAIDRAHRRAEIGATWIAPAWQRSAVNTEAKYLMLQHAFETGGANRIEFKTDARNARSRAALLRIGAQEEGTFRRHMVMPDGALRDSVYFSLIAEEWPAVKKSLEAKLCADRI